MSRLAIESQHIDRRLIRKLKGGDTNAFQEVFNTYSDQLFHYAFSYLKDTNDSEEIIQDVFLHLWEIKSQVDEEKSLKSFLYKMTVNRVFNHLKRQIVRQKYESYVMNRPLSFHETPEERMCSNELNIKIQNLLAGLPEQKRKIFIMSRLKGCSNAEIAEELGVSLRTVENQVYRATKFLKEHLKDDYLLLLIVCFCCDLMTTVNLF